MARMKALKTFFGDEGSVKRGREFEARDANARTYEQRGLAVPVGGKQIRKPTALPSDNKAAEQGPLPLAGGPTGAANALSSLQQVRPPKTPRSTKSKAAAK